MIERAREIAEMMNYESTNDLLEAIGRGELALLKMPHDVLGRLSSWLRSQSSEVKKTDAALAQVIEDLARGLDLAMELARYPMNADVCDLDLPNGWPSYCER